MHVIKRFSFRQWSLRSRVSVLVAFPLLCITLLTVYNINSALNRETASLQDRGEKLLLLAADAAQLALFAGDEASLDNLGNAILRDSQIAKVLFFDEKKVQLSGQSTKQENAKISAHHFDDATHYTEGNYWYFVKSVRENDIELDEHSEQYVEAEKTELLGWVVLAVDLTESRDYRAAVMRSNLLVATLMLSLALLLAFRFSRAVVQPINQITLAIGRYEKDDFNHRVDEVSAGELGDLERGVNKLAKLVGQSQSTLREEVTKATEKWMVAAKDLEDQNVDLALAKVKAEQANEAKGDFLARMSHELRTPLTGIMGFVRLLSKTEPASMRQEYSDMILASSSVLLSTINDILDFSKLRANSFSLRPVRFNLALFLCDILNQHRVKAFEKGIELNALVDSDVPVEVFADIDKLHNVVSNIVSNALKFTVSGDIVMFVSVSQQQDGEATIVVSISDTGIGISPSDIEHLFDPFFQTDESSTRSHDGTGLGLSIAKDFVTLMGGSIEVESEEGEGSEVEFSFRCTVAVDSNSVPENSWRVVLYDKNPWTRRSWRNQLLQLSSDVRAPASKTDLTDTLRLKEDVRLLLLGFNHYSDSIEDISALLKTVRTEFSGVIVIVAADDGSIRHSISNELYGPLLIVSKPLIDVSGMFDKADAAFSTTFNATAQHEQHLPVTIPDNPGLLRGLEVLVAEDNRFNQQLLATLFEAAGANVVLVNDGEEALRYCDGHCFDVLILDLHMPKLDGLQLTLSIRGATGANTNTPIVILTADVFQQKSVILEAGANTICYKPVDETVLIESVRLLAGVSDGQVPLVQRSLISLPADQVEEEVNHQLQCIADALAKEDLSALKRQVHQLLGVIGLSGIEGINSRTKTLNRAILEGDFTKINKEFTSLSAVWSNTLA